MNSGIFGWLLRLFTVALFATGGAGLDLGGGDDGAGDMGDLGGDGGDGGDAGGADLGDGGDGSDLEDGGDRGQQLTAEQRRAAAQESRLVPEAKNLLKELKDSSDPKKIKLADSIRTALFSAQSWRQAFPGGIRQAREMRQAFDEAGGAEGIRAVQEERQSLSDELDTIDQAWEQADPQFIANLAEENPETFSKMAPVFLENWRKIDKDGYNYTTARIFLNTLQGSGVMGVISQLWALAQANKTQPGMPGVIEGLQQIGEWTEGIRQLASNQPTVRTDTGLKKLKDERTKFDNDRFTAFKQDVHQGNLRNLETSLNKHLATFLRAKNIDFRKLQAKDPETFKAILREAESRLTRALTDDKGFQRQKDALLKNRDRNGVMRLYSRKFDELLATDPNGPKIARGVANIFFRGKATTHRGGAETRRNQGGGNQDHGNNNGGGGDKSKTIVRMSSRPGDGQIDYSRTSDSMILDGQCYLRGKKEIHAWR